MNNSIQKKIEELNSKEKLFDGNGSRILVALSGGADSVALLLSLKEFYPKICLYACHVNHMLRGVEANRDMDFSVELCNSLNIPIDVLKTDVNAYAQKSGLSTELAARNIRYDFFAELCKKHGINTVATAHTLSDNAETVLFNLSRGTGISGLCGIPAKRPLNDSVTIIRPLLFVSRNEIEEYLAQKNQPYVTDSSNLTDDYTRNFFRHQVVPLFKKINPSFEESLKNTCITLKDTQIFIDENVNNNISDNVKHLSCLNNCILSGVIMKLYSQYTGYTLLEKVHIDSVISLIKNHSSGVSNGSEVCLPGCISAVIDGGCLVFKKTERNKTENISSYEVVLNKGFNIISNSGYAVTLSDDEVKTIPQGYDIYAEYAVDRSLITGKLTARNRRDGDKILCCGMNKKIKALFTQNKTSADLRNRLPFLCDDSGIIIVPKICISDTIKTKTLIENNILYIYIYSQTT